MREGEKVGGGGVGEGDGEGVGGGGYCRFQTSERALHRGSRWIQLRITPKEKEKGV